AVGVQLGAQVAHAREVILSGGGINSPQLLQLSGVGNARELEALGIDVVQDLPGGGENLQDHLEVYVQYACTQPVSVQPALKKWKRPFIGAQWLFLRSGPAATNHFAAGAVLRLGAGSDKSLRGGRLRPRERGRRLPQPHVPLPARRDPVRRNVTGRRARLSGRGRPDVLGGPRLGEDRLERRARPSRAPVQLPLDGPGPARVGGGRPR